MPMNSGDRLQAIADSYRLTDLRTGRPLKGAMIDLRLSPYDGWGSIERLRDGRGGLDPSVKEFVASSKADLISSLTYIVECGFVIAEGKAAA